MTKRRRKRSRFLSTLNLSPGTPVYTGEGHGPARITVSNYDEKVCDIRRDLPLEAALAAIDKSNITWIDIRSLHETETVTRLCERFGFHPIIEESLANTLQRPKLEEFKDYLYFSIRDFHFNAAENRAESTPVNLILGKGFVISTTESGEDLFTALYARLAGGKGRVRRMGPDYLTYALLDIIVDRYFLTLEAIGDVLDTQDEAILDSPTQENARLINALKTEVFSLRRSITPLREMINNLRREDTPFLSPETRVFIRDLYDHTILILESLDMYRERLSSMFDVYLSTLSNRMNAVMKVLTLISTIFIPLTFLAGVYGMNFKHMPELDKPWAYPALWGIMIALGLGMLYLFRKKRWL